jgi:rhodanese-related sulfurtransferase
MDFTQARTDILNWIENFVEQSNPNLNNWSPCPFARRSRLENRLSILEGKDVVNDVDNLVLSWDDSYDVIIFVYDKNRYTIDEIADNVEQLNKRYTLSKDILVLEDHPDDVEIVNTVKMNQGQFILVLCQRFSKVNLASAELKEQGYYDTWSKEYYDLVAGWRERYVFGDN